MSDKYEYLKKVIDKLHFGKYYESDFSNTDVEIAMRELKAICQSLPLLSPDVQTDIMRLLEAAQSRHLREVLKYKADGEEKFHHLLKEYNHFLQRQTFLPDTHLNPMEAISPDKIAESYKELYHNEWSAAYKALQKTGMIVMEEEIVKKLSTILHLVYELCRDEAKKHRSKIMETLVYPLGVSATIDEDGHSHFQQAHVDPETDRKLQPEVHRIQHETGVYAVPAVQEIFWHKHGGGFMETGWDKSKEIMAYVESCVRLCWLFSIQDPPMKLSWPEEGSEINEHVKVYTKHGKRVHYTVWPALYLHENGALLSKGVVQPY
uniref:Mitochondria-eating protein C-terminal domain-containing protein n=1 Tax=Magallana gigas TaxID=29159 RepID=K1RLG0_MAGGI